MKDILKARREKESSKATCTSPNWKTVGKTSDDRNPNVSAVATKVTSLQPEVSIDSELIEPTQLKSPVNRSEKKSVSSPVHRVSRSLFPSTSKSLCSPLQVSASPQQFLTKHQEESSFNSFQRQVLVDMKELKEMLQVVSANQSKLNLRLLPNEKVVSAPDGMPGMPAKTMGDLNKLEAYLEESPDNVSNVSVFLSAHVSKKPEDEHKSALKVMAHVLSNEVGAKFSLNGLKGKQKFSDLKLWSAVQGAILWKVDSDLTLTKKAVGKWLADAPWRGGESSSSKLKERKKSVKKTVVIDSESN